MKRVVAVSISLPAELLHALDELKGDKDRSNYVAELVEAEAKKRNVAIKRPQTRNDAVKEAYDDFVKSRGRQPTMVELQQVAKLSYIQVWNAAKSLGIETLSKKERNKVANEEARQARQTDLELEEYPRLSKWLRAPTRGELVFATTARGSSMRIGKLTIQLSKPHHDMDDALPEFTEKAKEILARHTPQEAFEAMERKRTSGVKMRRLHIHTKKRPQRT